MGIFFYQRWLTKGYIHGAAYFYRRWADTQYDWQLSPRYSLPTSEVSDTVIHNENLADEFEIFEW